MGLAAQLGDPPRRRGGDERRERGERHERERHEQEARAAAPAAHAPASFGVGWALGAGLVRWCPVAGRVPHAELRAVRIAQ
jgi:hypothetical protein